MKMRKVIIPVLAGVIAGAAAITGCSNNNGAKEASSGENIPEEVWIETDEDISPELTFLDRMELTYAEQFAIDEYNDGYRLISISDGSRFLIVPEGEEIPAELDEDIVALQQPIDHIYLVATAAMDMVCSLEALDAVRLSGTESSGWYMEEAKEAMERGDILYAGKYSAPDYELILSEGCRLAVENTMISHAPEVSEKLEKFGIPVFIDYSSYESHPLGRVEWIKLYGALLGKEEQAQELFLEQEADLKEASAEEKTGKTVAFFFITTNGAVNVRKSTDYVPKMIELAGGTYIFDELGGSEGKSSSVTMQMEEFYAAAKDADYLIYNSSIGGEIRTIEELLGKSSLLADFKAVQEGDVFCTTKNLYQESMAIGSLTKDIHSMLTGETEDMEYLYPLE